jgi:hypothetical protein
MTLCLKGALIHRLLLEIRPYNYGPRRVPDYSLLLLGTSVLYLRAVHSHVGVVVWVTSIICNLELGFDKKGIINVLTAVAKATTKPATPNHVIASLIFFMVLVVPEYKTCVKEQSFIRFPLYSICTSDGVI